MLARQSVLRRKGACAATEVVSSEMGRRSHDELISKEVERAVRDIRGKFPSNRAVSMVMPANGRFFCVLMFPFDALLLDHLLQARYEGM